MKPGNPDPRPILDQGGDMIGFVDPRSWNIIECNDHLLEAIGLRKSTLIGRDILTLYPRHTSPRPSRFSKPS